ncbi:MAG: quinoprotein relay system zinc metallohydrolase 1 [Marinobacter sp.]|uniref:quinoprotein relay system zinc metallohydrolase 1 n=1 Tax=Marinobacter sp. TaxID=50741 RepID=UPI00299D203F|nr:quinoprotein relay system zinc metallohydrolase 1 [Marinobacter sp.]MDX1633291.1 quinoprotein relay system zinc metallohydrolase 1 [Marinobacter sp.]
MDLRSCLCAALIACLSLPVSAELNYDLQPREIAEGVWLVEGSTENFSRLNGGNIVNTAFVVTGEGVVVIDTGPSRRYGEQLKAAIAAVTDQPVTHVLLTHHHPDHVFGNQAFEAGRLYALAGTIDKLASDGDAFSDNMYRLVGDWMRGTEVVLPPNTLAPGLLEVGDHRFRLMAFRGHTGADLAVLDETSGVLFASDLVFYNRALTTPQSPGLSVWADELAQLEALDFELLVPGHGPVVADNSAFVQMRDYLAWLDRTMTEAAERGLTMTEVSNLPIPARFADVAESRYELIRTVTHLYPRYEKQALALLPE